MKTIVELAQDLIRPYIGSEDKKYAANVAPVETSPATSVHTAGTQIIYNGVLYDVTADIAVNDVLATTGEGANIAAADDVSEQISNVKQALTTLSNREQERWGTVNLFDKDIMADVQIIELSYKTLIMKPNTTYTVSTDLPQNLENFANIFVYNSSGVPDTNANGVWNGQTRTFTTNSDGIINVAYRTKEFTNTSTKWFLNHNFQIEEGNIATAFQPYAAPNVTLTQDTKGLPQDMNGLTANAFANGAVNELLCDATSNVQTGLTYIVEDDGTIKVSGTNTSNETAQIAVTISYVDWDSTKRYRISGCPSNGSSSSYRLGLTINKSDGWSRTLTELGDGLEFQLASNETKIKVSINISAGYAISGTLTFKPMITVADMPNSDYAHYVPYAKSNKELTGVAKQVEGGYILTGIEGVSVTADGVKTYKALLYELSQALGSYLDGKDVYVKVIAYDKQSNYHPAINYPVVRLYHKSSDLTGLEFSFASLGGNVWMIRYIKVSINQDNCIYRSCDNGTVTDLTQTVPSSGMVLRLYFESYKKIS